MSIALRRHRRTGHQRPDPGRRQPRSVSSTDARWSSTAAGSRGWAAARRTRPPMIGWTAAARSVIPGFVDSHAHLVFAGERSAEFAARMSGEPYDGGGIATTVAATRAADDATLGRRCPRLADELLRARCHDFRDQERVRPDRRRRGAVAAGRRRVHRETTFLGAHVVPAEYRDDREGYVDLVAGDMLPACAPHARWIDVFCDRGAFDVDETRVILSSGDRRRAAPRDCTPANSGPARASGSRVELGAASVDHCTYATDDDIEALARAATPRSRRCCPGAEFSTRAQYPDARRFLDAGVTVALATDCNPGSSYTTSMPFCIAVAVRDMKFTPARGVVGGDRRRCGRAAPRRRRSPRRRASARTSSASTHPRTSIWPIGPVCRLCATSCAADS